MDRTGEGNDLLVLLRQKCATFPEPFDSFPSPASVCARGGGGGDDTVRKEGEINRRKGMSRDEDEQDD